MEKPLPVLPKKTFCHRAATFCLWSPFIAIAWNVFIVIPGRNVHTSDTQTDAAANLFLAAFFPVLGILAGIIALFGIRRHGRTGILWKAVIGLSIFLLLALLAIPNFLKARQNAREQYEQQYGQPPP